MVLFENVVTTIQTIKMIVCLIIQTFPIPIFGENDVRLCKNKRTIISKIHSYFYLLLFYVLCQTY